MAVRVSILASAALWLLSSATPVHAIPTARLQKRLIDQGGFFNVTEGGGSWLTANTGGLGEPINVVVSAASDAAIQDQSIFLDYMVSVGMGDECLGQHLGNVQTMNLGDGLGYRNASTLRYNYGDPALGTCKETIDGGNHLRYQKQNGSSANSGAWFLSVSYEESLALGHNIVLPDGYAFGRDLLTGNATVSAGTKSPITNRTFTTTSVSTPGYIAANSSVNINHDIVYDGLVDVWTVKITSNGSAAALSSTGSAMSSLSAPSWTHTILPLMMVAGFASLC